VNVLTRNGSAEREPVQTAGEALVAGVLLTVVALAFIIFFCLAVRTRLAVRDVWLWIPDEVVWQWMGRAWSRVSVWDRIPILCVAGWILGVALLVGRLLFDLLQVAEWWSRSERIVFSVGLGLNVLSLTALAFGLAGDMHRWWFVTITCLAAIGAGLRWRNWRQVPADDRPPATTGVSRTALIVAIPFCIIILLGSLLPPWHFDVREYHLQVPKEWYRQGYIGFLPHNVYGNMPLGVEMHALLGMILMWGPQAWWWGSLVGKTVIGAFAPLTAWALYLCGRRFVDQRSAAWGAILFISTPWVAHVSNAGMIDVAAAFYCVTAVQVVLRWRTLVRNESPPGGAPWGLPLLAGLLAGAGVSCKYPAVVFLVLPVVGGVAWTGARRVSLRAALLCVLGVACACGPWLAKNWALTGNPTYPLLYTWFDGQTRTPEKDVQWRRAHEPSGQDARERYSLNQLRSSAELIGLRSDYTSPLLAPLFLLGVFASRHRRAIVPLAAFCGYVVLTWWLMTHRVDRFLVPILPLVALIAGVGATWSATPIWRRGMCVLLATTLFFNLIMDASRVVGDNRFLVSLRDLQQDVRQKCDPEYSHINAAHRLLNELVQPGYRALLVGEAQVFNLEVPILYNTCFDDCVFEQLMRDKTRAERYETLREHRISHIAVFWIELERYRSPGNYGYSSYVSQDIVRREICQEQKLARRIPTTYDPNDWEILEVAGWREW
jgi:hypothetical protein